jgi:hypothetical protein
MYYKREKGMFKPMKMGFQGGDNIGKGCTRSQEIQVNTTAIRQAHIQHKTEKKKP